MRLGNPPYPTKQFIIALRFKILVSQGLLSRITLSLRYSRCLSKLALSKLIIRHFQLSGLQRARYKTTEFFRVEPNKGAKKNFHRAPPGLRTKIAYNIHVPLSRGSQKNHWQNCCPVLYCPDTDDTKLIVDFRFSTFDFRSEIDNRKSKIHANAADGLLFT